VVPVSETERPASHFGGVKIVDEAWNGPTRMSCWVGVTLKVCGTFSGP
jgi:hypothetical protein